VVISIKTTFVAFEKIIPECVGIDIIKGTGLLEVADGDDGTKEEQLLSLNRWKKAQCLW
jgi:hypothetical protein